MSSGDFVFLESVISRGARMYNVAAGTAILAGEPVQHRAVGDTVVQPSLTSTPVVGTSGVEGLFVGIATTNSTNTLTAAGTVYVMPVVSGATYIGNPTEPTSWDTQTEYDALVGKRVLLKNGATVGASNLNTGSYTILASDSAANGAVVMALDISKYPGKVAIAFRTRTSDVS